MYQLILLWKEERGRNPRSRLFLTVSVACVRSAKTFWAESGLTRAVIAMFFQQVYGAQPAVVLLEGAMIAGYLFLAIQAAREHPQ